ncbi:hypothetical protein [Aminobacter sp. BE322]|uniref:hypothetical protein n=1 Tax=unclassified Aminobacter TaxID=2644704 RepID=UPI003D245D5B
MTYELLRVSADMAALIDAGGSEAEIAKAAILGGMVPMHEHAMSLVSDNITTIDEVSRVLDYGGD